MKTAVLVDFAVSDEHFYRQHSKNQGTGKQVTVGRHAAVTWPPLIG